MPQCIDANRFKFNQSGTALCPSTRARWCVLDIINPTKDTSHAQLIVTTGDNFLPKSRNAILEVEAGDKPTFEFDGDVVWELVCTYQEPQPNHRLVGCQQQIVGTADNVVCINKCNSPDGHVYASTMLPKTNNHIFKRSSSLCKSAAFAGIPLNKPFRIMTSDAYANYIPMNHNGVESELSLAEKGLKLVVAGGDELPTCYDYINVEKNMTMEVWASSERESEIYDNQRRWEARHAFSNNTYEPIPWAADTFDPLRYVVIDFKREHRINRLHFMNVIHFESSIQNYYCNKTEIYFSNDDCYELTSFTLYKTVDTMTRDSQLALADVNMNAKCLQFYPKECNDDIATVKVHLYGCPAASLPVRNNEINNEQSPTLIDIVHARSDLIILLSGVLVAVIALLILVITMCTRKSRRQEEPSPAPTKSVSGSQSLNVRLNYDRVSNSYQPVILRVESNGVLTDIGTLNLPRLVPEDTQSAIVRSPTDQLPDLKPSKGAMARVLGNPYLDEKRWLGTPGNRSVTQSEQDNVYSDIDDDYLSRQVDAELLRAQSTSALDNNSSLSRAQKKPSFRPNKPPRRSKKRSHQRAPPAPTTAHEPHSYHSLEAARKVYAKESNNNDPYNKLLLDL